MAINIAAEDFVLSNNNDDDPRKREPQNITARSKGAITSFFKQLTTRQEVVPQGDEIIQEADSEAKSVNDNRKRDIIIKQGSNNLDSNKDSMSYQFSDGQTDQKKNEMLKI